MEIKTKEDFNLLVARLVAASKGECYAASSKNITRTKLPVIGVATPGIRALAKEVSVNSPYLESHANDYYETLLMWGFVLGKIKDRELGVAKLEEYISLIDSWALVDQTLPSLKFITGTENDFELFGQMLNSDKEFVVRYGVIGMMKHFIGQDHIERTLEALYQVKCDKYYVNMAVAWLLSEVIIKNPQNGMKIMQKIIKNHHFNKFIINKAIQKARESYRLGQEYKQKLNEIKI